MHYLPLSKIYLLTSSMFQKYVPGHTKNKNKLSKKPFANRYGLPRTGVYTQICVYTDPVLCIVYTQPKSVYTHELCVYTDPFLCTFQPLSATKRKKKQNQEARCQLQARSAFHVGYYLLRTTNSSLHIRSAGRPAAPGLYNYGTFRRAVEGL